MEQASCEHQRAGQEMLSEACRSGIVAGATEGGHNARLCSEAGLQAALGSQSAAAPGIQVLESEAAVLHTREPTGVG